MAAGPPNIRSSTSPSSRHGPCPLLVSGYYPSSSSSTHQLLGVCRRACSWCARTAWRRGKVCFQPVAGRRSCLTSSRLLYLVAAPCGARERRARSDGRRARGARGARASPVVNHRRSRAGVSRRAAVLFSSSVLSAPSPRAVRAVSARRPRCLSAPSAPSLRAVSARRSRRLFAPPRCLSAPSAPSLRVVCAVSPRRLSAPSLRAVSARRPRRLSALSLGAVSARRPPRPRRALRAVSSAPSAPSPRALHAASARPPRRLAAPSAPSPARLPRRLRAPTAPSSRPPRPPRPPCPHAPAPFAHPRLREGT